MGPAARLGGHVGTQGPSRLRRQSWCPSSRDPEVSRTRGSVFSESGRVARPGAGGGRQGGHSGFPASGRCRASRPRVSPPAARPPSRSPGRRHVFRGQRERLAAPGGAAQAGGRRGEDQGEAGAWPRARRPPRPAPSRRPRAGEEQAAPGRRAAEPTPALAGEPAAVGGPEDGARPGSRGPASVGGSPRRAGPGPQRPGEAAARGPEREAGSGGAGEKLLSPRELSGTERPGAVKFSVMRTMTRGAGQTPGHQEWGRLAGGLPSPNSAGEGGWGLELRRRLNGRASVMG